MLFRLIVNAGRVAVKTPDAKVIVDIFVAARDCSNDGFGELQLTYPGQICREALKAIVNFHCEYWSASKMTSALSSPYAVFK